MEMSWSESDSSGYLCNEGKNVSGERPCDIHSGLLTTDGSSNQARGQLTTDVITDPVRAWLTKGRQPKSGSRLVNKQMSSQLGSEVH